jgi:pilus assembly protein Flp/PilA
MNRKMKNQKGQGLAEYALIIALVAVVLVGALTTFRTDIEGVFGAITTALSGASGGGGGGGGGGGS